MIIRKATTEDIEGLTDIVGEFGYSTTYEKMEKRMSKIIANCYYNTLVAEIEGEIIGMLGMHIEYSYVSDDDVGRIIAMVVHSNYRNKGIGEQLIQQAEDWCERKGITTVVLNSGNREERKAAHEFYKRRGYKGKSTGFYKTLIK
ncbi:GNAT family N-acetyltransferase [Halobacillus amylolyticus]|uniref:GNAT family N-acetyltransferase n=1 Tax=Halobacillus amylolyticus TaxID=2932259 RepID=A0ABY4HFH8_9BACI|nr:GNAT family N-acetyltransferase [Halobacillus amylolyticus]UOR13643.1 GNAT family N-acetyltransferase [Halobacillus amylolyticus]